MSTGCTKTVGEPKATRVVSTPVLDDCARFTLVRWRCFTCSQPQCDDVADGQHNQVEGLGVRGNGTVTQYIGYSGHCVTLQEILQTERVRLHRHAFTHFVDVLKEICLQFSLHQFVMSFICCVLSSFYKSFWKLWLKYNLKP